MRVLRVVVMSTIGAAWPLPAQPPAPMRPVSDRYPGLMITDPYRWMERAGSSEFRQWLDAQDRHTSDQMRRLPGRAALAARVHAAASPDDAIRRVTRGGQQLFFVRPGIDSATPVLRHFDLERRIERVLWSGRPMAEYVPSADGAWIAITTADNATVLLMDVLGARVIDSLPRGATVAGWDPRRAAIFFHRLQRGIPTIHVRQLGAPTRDSLVVASGRVGAPVWRPTDDVRWMPSPGGEPSVLQVRRDETVVTLRLRMTANRWSHVVAVPADVQELAWQSDVLFLRTSAGLMRFAPQTARLDTLRAAVGRTFLGITAAADGLYLLEGTAATASLSRWQAHATTPDTISLPVIGGGRTVFGARSSPGVVLPVDRWLGDGGWYRVNAASAERLPLTTAATNTDRFVVEVRTVRAVDGTQVPVTIVRRRDLAPDRVRLTWIMAYGAYGIAMTPLYQSLGPALVPFLEDGGVYAVAHVRGGGEFGREWHDAGRADRKPNGYRDLIAVAESLIAWRWARSDRLVIEGASGGGATVGMAGLTRPELFRVVITNVPDANTLRLHATPDGPYMRDEWGDIRTARGTRALAAMDLTHHVRRGTTYPAWWATTGLRDESVPPWQPGKVIAHLQASGSARPALLRTFAEEGHVLRPAAQRALAIDLLAFALWQIGAPEFQPRSDGPSW